MMGIYLNYTYNHKYVKISPILLFLIFFEMYDTVYVFEMYDTSYF